MNLEHPQLHLHWQARGFTLIEVLVAITISGIILASIGGVFFTAIHLRNSVTANLEQALPVEQALTSIRHDLAAVAGSISTNGIFIGPLQSINQTNMLPDQIGPDFYTTTGQLDGMSPAGDMVKIDYLLTAPTNRMDYGKNLVRASTWNLLPVNPPPQPEEKRVLLTGVDNVIFYYYDGTTWQQTWDTTQQTNLPYGIKMQIQMASSLRGRATTRGAMYELVVPVSIQVTTNVTTPLP